MKPSASRWRAEGDRRGGGAQVVHLSMNPQSPKDHESAESAGYWRRGPNSAPAARKPAMAARQSARGGNAARGIMQCTPRVWFTTWVMRRSAASEHRE